MELYNILLVDDETDVLEAMKTGEGNRGKQRTGDWEQDPTACFLSVLLRYTVRGSKAGKDLFLVL